LPFWQVCFFFVFFIKGMDTLDPVGVYYQYHIHLLVFRFILSCDSSFGLGGFRVRKLMGGTLVLAAIAGLFPLWTEVQALQLGRATTPGTDPAVYRISSTASLLRCSMPAPLVLTARATTSGAYVSCVNNYNSPITLTWSVVDDGPGTFLTASGSSTLAASGVAACQAITVDAGTRKETRTVVFRGTTSTTAGFYVEHYFTGQVTVQQETTGVGGGCP